MTMHPNPSTDLATDTLEGYRISPQQARLRSLQQRDRQAPYHLQVLLDVNGSLEQLPLRLQGAIARYEILRTRFDCLPGMTQPLQVIQPPETPQQSYPIQDLSSLTPQEQEETLEAAWQQMQRNVPDRPLQVKLWRQSPQRGYLLLQLTGVSADGPSLNQLLAELQHPDSPQPDSDSPLQYADLAEWQRDLLESPEMAEGQQHWQKVSREGLAVQLREPGLSPPPEAAFAPDQVAIELPQPLVQSLQTTAAKYDVSLSNLLLTAWQALLQRMTGQDNLLIGTAFDGRHYPELTGAFGPLTRYLPIPCQFPPSISVEKAWQQVQTQLQQEALWQDYFTWDSWCPDKPSSFFPFLFDFSESDTSQHVPQDMGTVHLKPLRQWHCLERYHLQLSCRRESNSLQCQFYYDANRLRRDTVNRLANHYQTLLTAAVAQPHQPLNRLPLLTDRQQQQLLTQFNPSPTPSSQDTLPQRIQHQAERTPDNIAVIAANQHLTYSQLNQQANQLAHLLQQQGLQPDQPVGLYLNRNPNLIVGLLGILKAGGAYLPLDPSLPPKVLQQRLEKAQVQHLVSETILQDNLSELEISIIHLDQTPLHQFSAENPKTPIQPQHLAYIIYTSGSSGEAKGVAVEHQHILSYVDAIIPQLQLPDDASYASVSTIAADLGNTAIFGALTQGGCLHLIDSDIASNPEAFAVYAQQHRIDCLKIVPSHINALLDSASRPQDLLPRRCLVLGGEASTWGLIQQVRSLGNCRIINHYGPTETTVGVLAYDIPEPIPNGFAAQDIVPLGRPLRSSQVYLLDEFQQPVPIGVPGELYLGGTTVARGYWRQPQLTQERFITSPGLPGRLYRSGDWGRYTPDGEIEFLGRQDGQVKLRGYRVELGEIEAVLRQHPQVDEALVLLREGQLRAYGLTRSGSLSSRELQQFLAQRLPDYMVPGAIVLLSRWPLTANGKIDRQGLPEPELERSVGERRLPQTPTEKRLWQIWSEVLGSDEIGVDDNFFRLGGDSILSIQVVAKANQAGLMLTPKQMFEHQTIAELALVVGQKSPQMASSELVTGTFPLTPIQSWFFEQDWCEPQHWNQAVLLSCGPRLRRDGLQETLQGLVDHHDGLRTRFVQTPQGWYGEILPSGTVTPPIDWIDGSDWLPSQRSRRLQEEATRLQGSLKLDEGPLLRLAVFDWGEGQRQRLLIVIHHLLVDGVSWRILLEDFRSLYEGLAAGQRPQLPAKTTSISAWSQALLDYKISPQCQGELEFWKSNLQAEISELPLDKCQGENRVDTTASWTMRLTPEETKTLLQVVPAADEAQINDVFLTALTQAFQDENLEGDLWVDLEGHGRSPFAPDIDLSRTVGWFTTIYPLRLPLSQSSWTGALQDIQTQLGAIAHGGLHYRLLRQNHPGLQSSPQPQIKFNYLGQFDGVFQQSQLFQPATESFGPTRGLRNRRSHLLDIVGLVSDGQLLFEWTYSTNHHEQETVEHWGNLFLKALRSRIQAHQNQPKKSNQNLSEQDIFQQDLRLANAEISIKTRKKFNSIPWRILLTGSTGFLGAFLLAELLKKTTAKIYCLVRDRNQESAQKRLHHHLQNYQLWDERWHNRIIPIAGDLSQPNLGLESQQWQQLATEIDSIYHNGAAVNLAHPYEAVRTTNVWGTRTIIELATQEKLKPISYVSTLSVFAGWDGEQQPISEMTNLQEISPPPGGYARSKWVAEVLLQNARSQGVSVGIYRPGRIVGHQKTGICNTRDRLSLMIRGCLYLGYAPAIETPLNMTPVDYLSEVIVALSQTSQAGKQAFHLCNPHSLSWCDLVQQIQGLGYPLQLVSYSDWQTILSQQWQTHLGKLGEQVADHPLYPLMILFADSSQITSTSEVAIAQSLEGQTRQFDTQNTQVGLSDFALECPPINQRLVQRYLSYLSNTNR